MGFALAEAYVELSAKGFGGVMGHIGRVKSSLGGLVSFATGPLGVALAGIGAGASVAGMVSLAASIEQTETQFKTLLGSMEESKEMIADLQKFGASTPFEFTGLAEAAKTLLAFGTAQDQIIPAMQVLGDVAAATGSQIGELAGIYGKVQSRGALMTESLDQFNERGIPLGTKLAEMFGKTGDEIRDMASKGQISFGDLQKAMVEMTSEGGMAFNGMVDQSQTLGGVWSTLKDNTTMLMGDMGKAIIDGFDLKGVTTDFSAFVQQVHSEWMPSITDAFGRLREVLQPWRDTIGAMIEPMMDFAVNLDLYHEYITTSWGNSLNNMWQRVSTFFENAVTLGGWYVENLGTFFVNMSNNVGRIFGNMVEMLKNSWSALLDFFTTGEINIDFSPIVDNFNATMEGIKMPELKSAQLNALEGDLDRIAGELARRQDARRRLASDAMAAANGSAIDALAIQEGGEKSITDEKKKQTDEAKKQFGFTSVAGLADKMQEALNTVRAGGAGGGGGFGGLAAIGNAPVGQEPSLRDQMNFLQQQVTHLSTLASLATGSGLKIASPNGGISIPAASVQFGATGT